MGPPESPKQVPPVEALFESRSEKLPVNPVLIWMMRVGPRDGNAERVRLETRRPPLVRDGRLLLGSWHYLELRPRSSYTTTYAIRLPVYIYKAAASLSKHTISS